MSEHSHILPIYEMVMMICGLSGQSGGGSGWVIFFSSLSCLGSDRLSVWMFGEEMRASVALTTLYAFVSRHINNIACLCSCWIPSQFFRRKKMVSRLFSFLYFELNPLLLFQVWIVGSVLFQSLSLATFSQYVFFGLCGIQAGRFEASTCFSRSICGVIFLSC